MDIGFSLPSVGPAPDREFVLEVTRAAERLGFHSVWTTDHVGLPANRTSRYPYPRSTTELAFSPGMMWLDPVAVMGFVAGVTERIVVGTSVLVLPYRNPLVLANEMASLDRLSEGRVILGVGVGWMDEEFEALGVPKRERGARTDEYLRAMRALWDGGPATFEGRFVQVRDLALATAPATAGGPPVYVGGNEEPGLRRALTLGDGWLGFEIFLGDLPGILQTLGRLGDEVGRDPAELTLSVRRGLLPPFEVTNFLPDRRAVQGSPSEIADEIGRFGAQGISLMVFDLAMIPPEMVRTMEWFAAEVAPLLD
ncbi:MAG: LLM class F420-dependent oxidoreductase [Actinomycetota bacterium]